MARRPSSMSEIRKLHRRIKAMRARVKNLTPVLKKRAMVLEGIMLRSYSLQRDQGVAGKRWAKLRPATANRKPRISKRALMRSGRMRNTTQARADGPSIVFGFGVPYAIYHHEATGRMRRAVAPLDRAGKPDLSGGRFKTWWSRTTRAVYKHIFGSAGGL